MTKQEATNIEVPNLEALEGKWLEKSIHPESMFGEIQTVRETEKQNMLKHFKTRRERLKSALYLRLKKAQFFKFVKGGTLSTFWKSSLLQKSIKLRGTLWRHLKKI